MLLSAAFLLRTVSHILHEPGFMLSFIRQTSQYRMALMSFWGNGSVDNCPRDCLGKSYCCK